ncbi:MAG: Nitrogenase molybdenum-iron protein beta chain [Syntrophorhabdaceae bacterium PtaU1.Bin034]|nr:MAG: Nitrogenase molybdenum-iron protein beta chain [Syntrophorhabdaceae bacterium PtaU1.Bin034]
MRQAEELLYNENELRHSMSTQNACKLCAPLGASVAFRGIENCIPLIHGSQGCSTYIRRYVISHFREPIDIASSNFTESSAIFGGGENLKKALDNLTRQYRPHAVGIATTCLSETIGDDVRLYIDEYQRTKKNDFVPAIIHASTPSYRGTHMEGYHEAIRATIVALAEGGPCNGTINIVPGFVSAEDLRHLKEVISDFCVPFTMLPDYSETLDGESWEDYQKLSSGGTPIDAIKGMGRAVGTIQFGRSLEGQRSGAAYLEEHFGVPVLTVGLPIGIRETDRFFATVSDMSGAGVPEKYEKERGRLIDAYIDGHKYVFGKRAILYGEADFVAGMASLLDEIGMVPVICATGACTGTFKSVVRSVLENTHGELIISEDSDFVGMLEACESVKPDIIIGNSKGYFLSRRLGIPLVRAGFPIHDRIGGQRILHVCYRGTQQLFDRIVNALIEAKQNSSGIGYSYI